LISFWGFSLVQFIHAMITNCECQHCRGKIEFDVSEFELNSETSHRRLGQTVDCPHCHQPTQIYINKADFIVPTIQPQPVADPIAPMIPCSVCGNKISRTAWFCFKCGEFHFGLFKIVWLVVCYVAVIGAILGFIGFIIGSIIEQASQK
jgi:hypothetical protein